MTNLGADIVLADLRNSTHLNIESGWFSRQPSPLLVYLTVHDLEVRTQGFQKATVLPISCKVLSLTKTLPLLCVHMWVWCVHILCMCAA